MLPNPLNKVHPLNAKVATHYLKDVAMAAVATKFIGKSAAAEHVPSSTRNYERAWGDLANFDDYSDKDIVMVSGSGSWRGVSLQRIKEIFHLYYTPLLDSAAKAHVTFVVGRAKGTDELVKEYLENRGYGSTLDNYQNFIWMTKSMKILECHTKGDTVGRSFSPFNCFIEINNVKSSIEDLYQSAKVFAKIKNGKPFLIKSGGWEDSLRLKKEGVKLHHWEIEGVELPVLAYINHKGNFTLEMKDFGVQYYVSLWHLHLNEHKYKLEIIKEYDGFNDPFAGTFPFSQARVLMLAKEKGLSGVWDFSRGLRARLNASEDDLELAEGLAAVLPKTKPTPRDWELSERIIDLGGQQFLPDIYTLEPPF